MSGEERGPRAGEPDLAALAEDWITLWQSEIAALAADREWQEGVSRLAALWAGLAAMALRAATLARNDGAAQRPAPAATPRTAPAAFTSEPRDAELDGLARRLAALEERLVALERASRGRADRRRPRTRRGGN